jgi:acetylornithine/succinyldiaminopimelate/putrescine aminotransferase
MQLTNRQLFQQNLAIPGDVPNAIEIAYAEGIYLYSETGDRYVDLVSGVSVSNIGHRHPSVLKAVEDQMGKYMHLMVYGKYIQSPQVKLVGLLAEQLPINLQSIYLVNSGSEAIEGALKLAKRVTGRAGIVSFTNAYHGSTHGALSVLGNEEMKSAYRPLLPDVQFGHFNQLSALPLITEKTACVIVETIQAEAGIIVPDKSWISALRFRCTETGTLLIFDEVQMGFGRTGKLMAFEHFDVIPDILCLAKGMGGGMPIGAFVSSREFMNQLTYNPALGHITTFGGHPVSAAAAMASLQVIINEDLATQAEIRGKQFVQLLEHHPLVSQIRQIGLMLAVELVPGYSVSKLVKILQKNRLIVDQFLFNSNSFRIAPPLTITTQEVASVAEQVIQSLNEL